VYSSQIALTHSGDSGTGPEIYKKAVNTVKRVFPYSFNSFGLFFLLFTEFTVSFPVPHPGFAW